MNRTIHSDFSGHTCYVSEIDAAEVPEFVDTTTYQTFYTVRNFNAQGIVFMYLGKGDKNAPKQIVAWYRKGGFWSSYGTTLKDAIEGAQRDGWLSA